MPVFTVTGDVAPFLHVSLRKGEIVFCESDAMVMMEDPLDLTGSVQGGLVRAAMRRLANGESFFKQRIEAKRGDEDCLLAPNMPGGPQVLDLGARQYRMSDGAYVAATERVKVNARMQSLGTALLGGTGGFFIGKTQGSGQVVVGGFGSLFTFDVTPGKDVVIDNGHVVAWDSSLRYEIAASTSQSQGLLRNLTSSVTSGEGIVLRFSGQGQVIVCWRNQRSFLAWLAEKLNVRS